MNNAEKKQMSMIESTYELHKDDWQVVCMIDYQNLSKVKIF